MNDLDWEAEHVRFMTVAYARTVTSAKRAFWGWHSRKRDDAMQDCLAKMWDQWSRLLLRGRDPEPMLKGLVKYAILWARYDRRIGGSTPMPDVYDYRTGFTQGDSDTRELVGRTNRPAHPLSKPRGGLRPIFSR